jgi:hypothetical protein
VGIVNVTGYSVHFAKMQLRQIAMSISRRVTIWDFHTMALDDFFTKHGHPQIRR